MTTNCGTAVPMWGYSYEQGKSLIGTVHDEEVFDAALASGRGVLLMVAHIGNWEILNNYLVSKTPFTAMYRPLKMTVFNRWMVARRERIGAKLVETTGQGVMALFERLRQGEMVVFLSDQEPKRERGIFVPFMGVQTLTPKLPHQLLQETGAIAVFAFVERLPDAQGFDVHLDAADPELYDADLSVSATSMNASVARCVARAPAQYQWTYKRFKSRPEPEPYKAAKCP